MDPLLQPTLPSFSRASRPYSVEQLTLRLKDLVETAFPDVWVAGEISNLARPQSGHVYLTLKDERAQLRAVLWRSAAARLRFELHDGLEVICRGGIDLYPPRGQYQLVIQEIAPKGMGALELAFRQLREKLAAEGLFDPARKRPIPAFPRSIAIVTSPTGAAVRDFLKILKRRWRLADVLILPSRVQGEGAAAEVAAAIALANRIGGFDCLVVTRGGGSLEDLWTFNEESVVRAIHASRIPVVSAVGHEVDVTLCDLVADLRALTPSEAAERVAQSADELLQSLRTAHAKLHLLARARVAAARTRLEGLARLRSFRRPLDRIHEFQRRLDEWAARAARAARNLTRTVRSRLDALAARLDSLSPLAVLGRGYSLTTLDDGTLVRTAGQVKPGDRLMTRFGTGRAASRVEETEP
jgi:exodeoxyribonuclease VII large subunit